MINEDEDVKEGHAKARRKKSQKSTATIYMRKYLCCIVFGTIISVSIEKRELGKFLTCTQRKEFDISFNLTTIEMNDW